MSCWNVRVIKRDGVYGLGEVFYGLEGKANGWTATSEVFADTREQLLERVMSALSKPVLVPNEDGTAHAEEPPLWKHKAEYAIQYLELKIEIEWLKRERTAVLIASRGDHPWTYCWQVPNNVASYCPACKEAHAISKQIRSAAAKMGACMRVYKKASKESDK